MTKVPTDTLNANLRKLGRCLTADVEVELDWDGDERGLICTWPDGFTAFVGMGAIATAVLDASCETKH